MDSRTKNRLSDDVIAALVAEHFDGARVTAVTELDGGMFNAIYRIACTAFARDIVLKVGVGPGVPLLTYERDIMRAEVACYRLLHERTDVPAPTVLAYDFGRTLIDADCFFMTALDGEPLSKAKSRMSPENLTQVKRRLAQYLARMHTVTNDYYGYPTDDPSRRYVTWRDAFLGMFDRLLADAREHRVRLPYRDIARVLERHAGLLDGVAHPALVDFDCHDGNVFVRRNATGWRIEGILDFERMFWGDPLADLPPTFVFRKDIRDEPDFLAAFLDAGGRQVFTRDDDRRFQLYRLYLAVIMAAETFRYGRLYGAAQRAWAVMQVRSCLRRIEA